jgi:hypothetical protein
MNKRRDTMPANPKPNGVREPPGVASQHQPVARAPHVGHGDGLHVSAELVIELQPHEYPHVRVMIGCGS